MFTVRRIPDDLLQVNRASLEQVKEILRSQIPGLDPHDIDTLGTNLRDPFTARFRSILFSAETSRGRVLGFASIMHETRLGFLLLDFLASDRGLTSRGIGGALYERVRDEALALGCQGVFFECLPDEAEQCPDPKDLRQARSRLRFYEHYGARPIAGTDYQRPIKKGDTRMPFLVFDGLGSASPLQPQYLRRVVRVILKRKYGEICSPKYINAVTRSIRQDPVQLRPYRYRKQAESTPVKVTPVPRNRAVLVVNDRHDIHHVSDRGYVEAPVRIPRILAAIESSGAFRRVSARRHSLKPILAVHDADFVDYLRRTCAGLGARQSVYPYVFPVRNQARPPKDRTVRAGYYCIDTFTPLNANAWRAALRGVDCTLTAAETLLDGQMLAYALVRPPGHHAEHRVFGGFCYLNNNAIAAQLLSTHGRVAILDIDYHHGNGQQDIFFQRADVLTISIHGHPDFAYPYFTGFGDEVGEGAGAGFNWNLPLGENVDGPRYEKTLERALQRIRDFRPTFLIVALGLDTAKHDPTGTWSLARADFRRNGKMIGALHLPTLVVQEGGYRTRTLGPNAAGFFDGFFEGARP